MSVGTDAARGQGSAVAALVGKSITSAIVWKHGATEVVEINFTGGPYFVKFRQGTCEVGGTAEWNTGSIVAL